jgi:hypothetical protein
MKPKQIKQVLIRLAENDELPMDMNDLDESIFEDDSSDWLDAASHILCDSDLSVEEQVKLIAEQDDDTSIDLLEDVLVWEPLIGRYTASKFLSEIGYN